MEASNVKAMREALLMVQRLFDGRIMFQQSIREAHNAVNAALVAPPRNCDVGTAEEQTKIMQEEYCKGYDCYTTNPTRECPLYEQGVDCRLKWAQMPYEEGETDGSK